MATIEALWAAWERPGLEHLRVRADGAGAGREYTLLERQPDGARWRFRSLDDGFTAELSVDAAGLVRDYPGIARRLR